MSQSTSQKATRNLAGFTIVELLIVIIVIAILAAIVIVSYNGIIRRSTESSLQSTASQIGRKVFNYITDNSVAPTTLVEAGVKEKDDIIYEYDYNNSANPVTFCVTVTSKSISYYISSTVTVPTSGKCPGHTGGVVGPWTSIATSGYVSCGIYQQKPYCWGNGGNGALGVGSSSNLRVPTALTGALAGKTVTSIDADGCAISEGKAYCWGYNAGGRVGDNTINNAPSPVAVDTGGPLAGKTITRLSTASSHTCALADGIPYCWGDGAYGKLGNNDVASTQLPTAVDISGALAGKTITDISTGTYNTCAIANGQAYCWGWNLWGQIGNGTSANANYTTPTAVLTSGALNGKTLTKIITGSDHTCVVSSDGKAYCWGGMCSSINGTFTCYGAGGASSNSPVELNTTTGTLAGKTVTSIATDFNHSCAIADGTTYCWGYGVYGRLGDGTGSTISTPNPLSYVNVTGGTVGQGVAVGQNHSCGIFSGQAYCWGRNSYGEIGDNSVTGRNAPTLVINPTL